MALPNGSTSLPSTAVTSARGGPIRHHASMADDGRRRALCLDGHRSVALVAGKAGDAEACRLPLR